MSYNFAMSNNPVINGLAAELYIVVLVLVMNWGTKLVAHEDTFMAPVAMISLFTLSAAVMAYLFCYFPVTLFLGGKKKQSIRLFLNTLGVFGGLTILALMLFFLRFDL